MQRWSTSMTDIFEVPSKFQSFMCELPRRLLQLHYDSIYISAHSCFFPSIMSIASVKTLPHDPSAHNLHPKVSLPKNEILDHFLSRTLLFFTSSTSSSALVTVKVKSYHLCFIRDKILQRGKKLFLRIFL